jgi:type I restriction enzyme S subunit
MLSKTYKLLEEHAKITVGFVGPMADQYVEEGVPFLRSLNIKPYYFSPDNLKFISTEFHEKIKKSKLNPGDVAVVRTGVPGASCVIPVSLPEANCSDLVIIRCKDSLDPYFISYYVNSIASSQIKSNLVGAIQKHFNIGSAKQLPIPDITIFRQRLIGETLRSLDAKIDLNNRINAELESLARTIYDYWFLQFDFPDGAGKPYRSSGGEMRFDEGLKREVPATWSSARIGDKLTRVQRTEKINRDDYSDSGTIPIIDQSRNYIAGYTDNPLSKIENEHGVVVFGDHTRVVKYVQFDFARGADGTQVMFSDDPRLPTSLFYQKINSIDLSNYGYARHYKFLKDVQIVIPSEEIAFLYNKVATPLWNKISTGIKENAELSALRDWLLPLLMSGEVVVGE